VAEWAKNEALRKIEALYDAVWVYGCKGFWDPLTGLEVPRSVRARMTFTGHLRRSVPRGQNVKALDLPANFILVTAGGGGDGGLLMRQVLGARECDRSQDFPLVMILGPFMAVDEREEIRERARHVANVTVLDFESQIEAIMLRSTAIVSMGGYNTFCEILSFDRPALLVPRKRPRSEQRIRAERAAELGLVDMLDSEAAAHPARMAEALHRLPLRQAPSECDRKVDLRGLETIADMAATYFERSRETVALGAVDGVELRT
jgi:predicted glycosyltransferase